MNEQEIRKLIPELIWEKVEHQHAAIGHEEYQALYCHLGFENVYYRIVHPAQDPEGMYYLTKVLKSYPNQNYPCWLITTAHSLEEAKQLAQEHQAKLLRQMLMTTPSSEQPAKPTEDAKPINMRELLWQELDLLADEAICGEWDTLPNEMKYFKRKQYDTLLSYLTLLDQLAECEAKNAQR